MVDFWFRPWVQTWVNNTDTPWISQTSDSVSPTQGDNVRTIKDLQPAIEAGKAKGYGVLDVIQMAEDKWFVVSDKKNYMREVAKLKSEKEKEQMQSKISGASRNALIWWGIMSTRTFWPKIRKAIKDKKLDKVNVEWGMTQRQSELNRVKQEILWTSNAQIGFDIWEQWFMWKKITKSLNDARDMAFNSMVTDLWEKGSLRYDDVVTHVFNKAKQAQEVKANMIQNADTTLWWKSFDMKIQDVEFNPIKNAIYELDNISPKNSVTTETYLKYQNFRRSLDKGIFTLEDLTELISDLDKQNIYHAWWKAKDKIKAARLAWYRDDLDWVLKRILPELDDVNKTIRGNMAVANDVFGKYIKRLNAKENEISTFRRKISDLTYHIVPVWQVRPQWLFWKDWVKTIAKQEKNLATRLREYWNLLGMNIKKSWFFPKAWRVLWKTLRWAWWIWAWLSVLDAASADEVKLPEMKQWQTADEAGKYMMEWQYWPTSIGEPDTKTSIWDTILNKVSEVIAWPDNEKKAVKIKKLIEELSWIDLVKMGINNSEAMSRKINELPEDNILKTDVWRLLLKNYLNIDQSNILEK